MSPLDEAARAARNGQQTAEAAAEVIGHRLAVLGQALADPLGADHAELSLMAAEKVEAMALAGRQAGAGALRLAAHASRIARREQTLAADLAARLARSGSPGEALAVQTAWMLALWGRAAEDAWTLGVVTLRAQSDAAAPIHDAVQANVARLRR